MAIAGASVGTHGGNGDGDDWPALVRAKGKCNINDARFSDATVIAQGNRNGAMAAIVGTEGKYHGKSIDDRKEFETMIEHLRR